MTKLLEWLSVFIVLLSAYLVVVTRQVQSTFLDEWMFEFTLLPIVAVGLFGVSKISLCAEPIDSNACECVCVCNIF